MVTSSRKRRPASTLEGREQQLSALAVDLAEKQLREGTASAQVITHYLKLASTREKLEQKKLESEVELRRAQIESIESQKSIEELYANAIKAMQTYAGNV